MENVHEWHPRSFLFTLDVFMFRNLPVFTCFTSFYLHLPPLYPRFTPYPPGLAQNKGPRLDVGGALCGWHIWTCG